MADISNFKKTKLTLTSATLSRSYSTGMMSPASTASSSPGTTFSPITNLAMTLGQLNTSSESESLCDTPKRKLSMSSGSPTPSSCRLSWSDGKRMPSFDECDESPLQLKFPRSTEKRCSNLAQKILLHKNKASLYVQKSRPKPTSLLRKIQSMPQNGFYSPLSLFEDAQRTGTIPVSPKFPSPHSKYTSSSFIFHDENSHDSGLGDSHSCKDEDFHFAAPIGMPPRSCKKQFNEDACSPLSYSPLNPEKRGNLLPPTCLFSPDDKPIGASPGFLKKKKRIPLKTLLSSDSNISCDDDDGFLEMMDDIDDIDEVNKVSGLKDLIKAPIISSTCSFADAKKSHDNRENISPPWKKRVLPRGLFRSPSAPRLNLEQAYERGRPSFKRPDPPRDDLTPVLCKRRKSVPNLNEAESEFSPRRLAAKVERCNTDNELTIKTALSRCAEEPNLIGDFSRAYCLPHVPGHHSDMKYITPDTLADLIDGKYGDMVEDFHIADCRYPYEFKGGHIKGAKSLYTREDVKKEFLDNRKTVTDKNKRLVIIFHCEFSSERGPKLSRFLRKEDRATNAINYPELSYPELYLLEGGYKAFYNQSHLQRLCAPQGYTPMLHEDYIQDLKHFRQKSKSWNGERSNRFKPGLKF